jgi:hypothetical protein
VGLDEIFYQPEDPDAALAAMQRLPADMQERVRVEDLSEAA